MPLPVFFWRALFPGLVALDLLELSYCSCRYICVRCVDDSPLLIKPEKYGPIHKRIANLDILGGFTGVTALVLFNFAWN